MGEQVFAAQVLLVETYLRDTCFLQKNVCGIRVIGKQVFVGYVCWGKKVVCGISVVGKKCLWGICFGVNNCLRDKCSGFKLVCGITVFGKKSFAGYVFWITKNAGCGKYILHMSLYTEYTPHMQ